MDIEDQYDMKRLDQVSLVCIQPYGLMVLIHYFTLNYKYLLMLLGKNLGRSELSSK